MLVLGTTTKVTTCATCDGWKYLYGDPNKVCTVCDGEGLILERTTREPYKANKRPTPGDE